MFERWRRRRRVANEAQIAATIGKLWARGDFESRWIAWEMLLEEVAADLGSGPGGDIQRFVTGSAIADMLKDFGYPDGAMSFTTCLVRGSFSWRINTEDEDDPEALREYSLEEILGKRAAAYRTAFHRFQRSIK